MNRDEKLFTTYNYVKGYQKFAKDAGIVKYANEEAEDIDANAVTQALMDEGTSPAEEAISDNKALEIAQTLVELAQQTPSPEKEKLEEAATDVAGAAAPSKVVEEAKAAAEKFAASIKAANDAITNKKPDQVLTPSGTDYTVATSSANAKGTGSTSLKTEKGEIGAQDNVDHKIVYTKEPEAKVKQVVEGQDIYSKDYTAPGKGGTGVKTEKGEIGTEHNVEGKLAKLALETTLAKIFKK